MQPISIANRTDLPLSQHDRYGEDVDRQVVVRATEYPAGYQTEVHWHGRAQLVYASAGVVTVITPKGIWVVPPQRAVWIPAFAEHQLRLTTPVSMRSLYIQAESLPWLPTDCGVVNVSPLLRELIVSAVGLPRLYGLGGRDERIMTLVLDEIQHLSAVPLHLPQPQDLRIKQITTEIQDDPADSRTLEDWGRKVGASSRTLARLFLAETGMTFRHWQRQARLLSGLILLAQGQTVARSAVDVGYDNPSAFIAMFKRSLGVTPRGYFATQSGQRVR